VSWRFSKNTVFLPAKKVCHLDRSGEIFTNMSRKNVFRFNSFQFRGSGFRKNRLSERFSRGWFDEERFFSVQVFSVQEFSPISSGRDAPRATTRLEV
jgi:hypothetical protein